MNNQPPENTDDLNPFEQQLRRSIRHVNAPETMAKFLLAAAEAEQRRSAQGDGPRLVKLSNGARVIAFPRLGNQTRSWASGAIAAALIASVTLGGVHVEHQREEHARTQKAERDFAAATRIENQTLQQVRRQVAQAGVPLN